MLIKKGYSFKYWLAIAISLGGIYPAYAKPLPENEWSRVQRPGHGAPQAIGGYANGCQTGAQVLEESGVGFVSIRRFRNRYYSQPVTLDLVRHVGKNIDRYHQQRILVGDLSMPIGGEMPYGHSSHQSGLDVDFWFYTIGRDGSMLEPDIEPPTIVDKAAGKMLEQRWKIAYRDALYAAATYPQTTRIFVNPIIKQYLCDTESDRAWLYKIRPWWGHDAHFHVRLACPLNSPECQSQAPVPEGDGCRADLKNWIIDQSEAILHPKPTKPSKPKPPIVKPATCQALLQQAQ